jgi:hypothetical protein
MTIKLQIVYPLVCIISGNSKTNRPNTGLYCINRKCYNFRLNETAILGLQVSQIQKINSYSCSCT